MDLTSITGINPVLDSNKNSASNQAADRITGAAKNLSSSSSEDELKTVLKDFESYFVEQVIKKAKDTFTHSDESGDQTMSRYKDMFMDTVIQELADDVVDDIGGNYTQQLYEQMKRNYNID